MPRRRGRTLLPSFTRFLWREKTRQRKRERTNPRVFPERRHELFRSRRRPSSSPRAAAPIGGDSRNNGRYARNSRQPNASTAKPQRGGRDWLGSFTLASTRREAVPLGEPLAFSAPKGPRETSWRLSHRFPGIAACASGSKSHPRRCAAGIAASNPAEPRLEFTSRRWRTEETFAVLLSSGASAPGRCCAARAFADPINLVIGDRMVAGSVNKWTLVCDAPK